MRKFNVVVNGKSYSVEVEEVNGEEVVLSQPKVLVESENKVSAPTKVTGGVEVNAPMPGTVLRLEVSNGAVVKKGQKVLVLEAMKMENDITATADGIITFAVSSGQSVETGVLLASIK